ncbi:MAG TPA: ABC transporter ATP-binding protein [Bacteroidia bacterium]|nr:ABC transporter ATP-binding protein [Bacteroidia bacterium]
MSQVIITANNVGKKYSLKHLSGKSKDDMFFGSIKAKARGLFSKSSEEEEFWALKDVSFEINQGDRVAILGRNGAGKSTLLKILSRIVAPTTGRIEFDGRMAALLEVGTGFHGDLTGRENIFLNGSILGMTKSEIKSKFDEIVAFSEVEKFLDTPVKRYSSGMYVRLAFAVAAHLDPEILIVDEVLAVGDAAFQKKCLGKMKEVSGGGKTILFVSHNMAAVQNICDKSIYLKNGQLVDYGKTEDILPLYMRSSQATRLADLGNRPDRMGNGAIRFKSINIKDQSGTVVASAQCGSPLTIELEIDANPSFDLSYVRFSIGIDDDFGQRITHLSNDVTEQIFEKVKQGRSVVSFQIPELPLKRGDYTLTLFCAVNGDVADWIQEAAVINVEAGDFFKTGKLPEESQGNFYMKHSVTIY